MGMTGSYGRADVDDSIATIRHALDHGCSFLDTADMYGRFTNEELVGRAIAGRRDEVVLATKFGIETGADGSWSGINGRPEYVRDSCDASLRRLGVDVIDVYYQHRVDPRTPVEETWGAMKELVDAGKVRHLGISEAAPATIRRAHAVHPVTVLQTEWSLWSRDPESTLLPTVPELCIGFVAYSPLGRGFLTGRFTTPEDIPESDFRRTSPRFEGENFVQNRGVMDRVTQLADEKGCTPAQLALAWLLHQGDDVVPIPGTTKPSRLLENLSAVDVELTAEDLRRLDEIAPAGATAGNRYTDMSTVDRSARNPGSASPGRFRTGLARVPARTPGSVAR
jgi:aryl-alcohol dehydrogenase-like predicted oxidoreductase